jgi:hypothetical protein
MEYLSILVRRHQACGGRQSVEEALRLKLNDGDVKIED